MNINKLEKIALGGAFAALIGMTAVMSTLPISVMRERKEKEKYERVYCHTLSQPFNQKEYSKYTWNLCARLAVAGMVLACSGIGIIGAYRYEMDSLTNKCSHH